MTCTEIKRRLRAAAKAAGIDSRQYRREVYTKIDRNLNEVIFTYVDGTAHHDAAGDPWTGDLTAWSTALDIAQPGDVLDVAVYEVIRCWGGGFETGDLLANIDIAVGTDTEPARWRGSIHYSPGPDEWHTVE
jgi:hypothetical protein